MSINSETKSTKILAELEDPPSYPVVSGLAFSSIHENILSPNTLFGRPKSQEMQKQKFDGSPLNVVVCTRCSCIVKVSQAQDLRIS